MRAQRFSLVFLMWFCLVFRGPPGLVEATSNSTSSNNNDGIVQVVETEVWDTASNSWRAISGERWANERGQSSPSPSEVKEPEGFSFDGDWKIVVSGGDSMGWEYQFTYLRPPKRRRIWLRSLKQKKLPPPPPPAITKRQTSALYRTVMRIEDDWNFKGFGVSIYKSLIFPSSFGLQLGLPLTMNFDWWDRHPELPSVSTSVAFFSPLTFAAFLSTSVHVEWAKWVLVSALSVIPRLLLTLIYEFLLPFIWTIVSTLVLPFRKATTLPPLPKVPKFTINKPKYNPELSERIGCSLSVRWSKARGFEKRCSYWHSYLPTFMHYRELLRMKQPLDSWWQNHFGSVGVSTAYPMPMPPNFSCSAQLSLSGLYFRNTQTGTASTLASSTASAAASAKQTALVDKVDEEMQKQNQQLPPPRQISKPPPPPETIVSAKMVAAVGKTKSSPS